MEAVPRLPMISFELKTSTEPVNFGPKIKQYITSFYHEDGESYSNEINNLETLRASAVRPPIDVTGCQLLKKYYCQLHFLKSRFPMEEGQPASVYFSWRDGYTNMSYSVPDIEFELMNILYNIGALHSKLGAEDSRTSPDGMKIACTHFQCAAWAFHTVREQYPQMVNLVLAPEVLEYMHLVCLAQAQECILEKSMLDNRKATIIAKVAVQVVEYYKQALKILLMGSEEGSFSDLVGSKTCKEWTKYLSFKVSYHTAIALLYQGQQSEEQQKMGERVAFYQKASEQLQDARKKCSNLSHQQEINEALAFTNDVIEGKYKAAKNENEFIYHEEIPDKDALQDVKGASLVKGIPFNINDTDVSGPDIFSRLVPMETHEASSMYSEQKAQFLRQLGSVIENKDRTLAEFMSSLQTDVLTQMHKANGLPQQIVDRAAAMSAKPNAVKDLIEAMRKLSNSYQEVEAMLKDINYLLKEEEQKEQEYQSGMGARPPSIITTDLKREAAKYQEAHAKASESNQNLHRAMTSHIANLKILSQPLAQLQQQIPSITLPNGEIDEESLKEMENLLSKVEEMKQQRITLWNQLRDSVQNDDITSVLITKSADQPLDVIFQNELEKHKKQAAILEQNMTAQDNICTAIIDAYAKFTKTRRYLNDIINLRNNTISALINSYDTYDDLLAKATKGIEFYGKLETNVTKLLQRVKSTCKVQDEEREQMLAKVGIKKAPEPEINIEKPSTNSGAPKLKDYLNSVKMNAGNALNPSISTVSSDNQMWPPSIRPAPVGSEMNKDQFAKYDSASFSDNSSADLSLAERMASLKTSILNRKPELINNNVSSQPQQSQHPQNYTYASNNATNYSYQYPTSYSPQIAVDYTNIPYSSYQQPVIPPQIPAVTVKNTVTNYSPVTSLPSTFQNQPPSDLQQYYPSYFPTSQYQPQTSYSYEPTNIQNVPNSSTQYSYYSQGYQDTPVSYPVTPAQYIPTQDIQKGVTPAQYVPTQDIQKGVTPAQYVPTQDIQKGVTPAQYVPTQDIQKGVTPAQYVPTQDFQKGTSLAITNTTYTTLSNTVPSLGPQELDKNFSNIPANHNYLYTTPTSSYATSSSTGFALAPTPTPENVYVNNATAAYPTTENVTPYDPTMQNYYPKEVTRVDSYTTYPPSGYQVSSEVYPAVNTPNNPYYQNANPQVYSNYFTQNGAVANISDYTYSQAQQGYHNQNVTYTSGSHGNVSAYAITPPSTLEKITNVPNIDKEPSNIDLLSGLDFSVNHPPLQPQKSDFKEQTVTSPKTEVLKESSVIKSEGTPKVITKNESPPLLVKLFEKLNKRRLFENLDTDGAKFLQELEKFEKFVEVLCSKTLSGPTTLDIKWKEIQDKQEIDQQKQIISVARCYPSKNRFFDILPYDHTRVQLTSTKDDYINASILKDITPHSPTYLVSQAPMSTTISDFWTMVWEQKVDFLVCLINDEEIDKDIYWPQEKGQQLNFGNWIVALQSKEVKDSWTQRIISLHRLEERDSRNLIHMQFTRWQGSLFPPCHIYCNFLKESINCWKDQQRTTSQPILVHCLSGIGRSGLYCLLTTAVIEFLNKPTIIPDLLAIASSMTTSRKNILRDREHLKFAFQVFLHYLHDIQLTSFGTIKSKEDASKDSVAEKPAENIDPFSNLDPLWATKKKSK